MFCPKCGNQVHDGVKFCPQCGNSLDGGTMPTSQSESRAIPQQGGSGTSATSGHSSPAPVQSKKSHKGLIIGGGIAAVAIVAVLIVVLISHFGGSYDYVGTWKGTTVIGSTDGIESDVTLTLNDDHTASFEWKYGSTSDEVWRETDDGIEVATKDEDNWMEYMRDDDKLVRDTGAARTELTKQ